MLKLFEVDGFKNFKDKITFNFADVRDYKFNTACISNNLLGKTIVYGKNSIGKTNLGLAIFDIVSLLSSNNVSHRLYDYYLNANINPYWMLKLLNFTIFFRSMAMRLNIYIVKTKTVL